MKWMLMLLVLAGCSIKRCDPGANLVQPKTEYWMYHDDIPTGIEVKAKCSF